MNDDKWFILYTHPRWEKRVIDQLMKRKIIASCPQSLYPVGSGDFTKKRSSPLFARYVFVHTKEENFALIKQIRGVQNFVYWLGNPVVVTAEEVETIQNFLTEYPKVKLEKTRINEQQELQIVKEPFLLKKGNLLEIRDIVVRAILPSLGYVLTAHLDFNNTDALIKQPSLHSGETMG